MKRPAKRHIRDLIERIARINASEEWSGQLSPAQLAALSYLAEANRFSRSPSQVAGFLATTRGTVSQTLKVLARKGLIEKIPSETDRRWASYQVTKAGQDALSRSTVFDQVLEDMEPETSDALASSLEVLIRDTLRARGMRRFGQCRTCRHYKPLQKGGLCTLLNEKLSREDARLICHEHQDAA